jgi:hypothetical protein
MADFSMKARNSMDSAGPESIREIRQRRLGRRMHQESI